MREPIHDRRNRRKRHPLNRRQVVGGGATIQSELASFERLPRRMAVSMSCIFLSHSSRDNFQAVALRNWLAQEGWDDVFLDLDPHRGIAAGERWERALHEAATRCEAVIFLVSANWLASGWCFREHALGRALNKKLFAVVIDPGKTIGRLRDPRRSDAAAAPAKLSAAALPTRPASISRQSFLPSALRLRSIQLSRSPRAQKLKLIIPRVAVR